MFAATLIVFRESLEAALILGIVAAATQAGALGEAVARGDAALTAIITAIALTVLREGSETVLFLMGIATSTESSRAALAIGSVLGLAAGAAAGVLMYAGLLRVPVS